VVGNPGNANINPLNSPTAVISGLSTAGIYRFIWSNNGCSDTMMLRVTQEANAGPNPPTVQCYQTGSAQLSAMGNGSWSINTTASTVASASFNATTANTLVSNFSGPGILTMVWTTNDGCSDEVTINVGNCICPINGNNIVAPEESEKFCNSQASILIDGSNATPAGGIYQWQYSLNNGPFTNAPGISNGVDYNTQTLGVGNHRFRRIYTTTSGIICSDTSNVINMTGVVGVNAGPDQTFECVQLNVLVINTSASGLDASWKQDSNNPATVNIANAFDGTTTLQGFTQSGIYTFIWDNEVCPDDFTVLITEKAMAGQNQEVECYVGAAINIAATGSGNWTRAANSSINASIANANAPNTAVSNFSGKGILNLIWTNTDGCKDTLSINVDDDCPCDISSNDIIEPDLNTYCNTSGNVTISGVAAMPMGGQYLWLYSFNDGPFVRADSTNDKQNYTTTNLGEGKHEFMRVYSTMVPGCNDTSETVALFVIADEIPTVTLSADPENICFGDTIYLLPIGVDGAIFNWTSDNGKVSSAGGQYILVPEKIGGYTIGVSQSANICGGNKTSAVLNVSGIVNALPVFDLGRDTTYCILDEERILDAGNWDSYLWNTGSIMPTVRVDSSGTYSVMVTDTNGCVGFDQITIKDFCCEFIYPNIFMENAFDNNEFFVQDKYNCVIKSELRIYDRWGNLIYISKDGLAPWDGTFNGKPAEQGVYVFVFSYTALDENDQPFDDTIKGDITLIRSK
jgi:gliding motility-associated-like protein